MRTFLAFALSLFLVSCNHNSSQTWEDVKTMGRYAQKNASSWRGKDQESRMFASDDEFVGPASQDFIPLNDEDLRALALGGDDAIPQPKFSLGEKGVPSFHHFHKGTFAAVHFETDEHILKEKGDIQTIQRIFEHLKKHPAAYLLVEGHTDERAPASYNMALGIRRANYIRAQMVKNGINPDRVYTVSHGKEQPLALGHTKEDWKKNRRAEFRVYEP